MHLTQDSQITFKPNLTCIFLSARARYIISNPDGRPCMCKQLKIMFFLQMFSLRQPVVRKNRRVVCTCITQQYHNKTWLLHKGIRQRESGDANQKGPSIKYVVSKSALFNPLPPHYRLFTKYNWRPVTPSPLQRRHSLWTAPKARIILKLLKV